MASGFRFLLGDDADHWLELDLDAESEAWAGEQAARLRRAAGLPEDWFSTQVLADQLALLVRAVAEQQPAAALAFFPQPGGIPAAGLVAFVEDDPDLAGPGPMITEVTPEPQDLLEPPQVTERTTYAGRATRLYLRYVDPHQDVDPPAEVVQIVYFWPLPADRTVLVVSVTFLEASSARQGTPYVDRIARDMVIVAEPPDDPSQPTSRMEVLPVSPIPVRGARRAGPDSPGRRARIDVDAAAGTLTWTSDRRGEPRSVWRLPDRGEPADLPEIHAIYRLRVRQGNRGGLVFADRSGRSLATSVAWQEPIFGQLWPLSRLAPLEDYGILVEPESFRHAHALNRAHPGASRHWYLRTFPWNAAIFAGPFVLAVVVFVLLIGYGVIS